MIWERLSVWKALLMKSLIEGNFLKGWSSMSFLSAAHRSIFPQKAVFLPFFRGILNISRGIGLNFLASSFLQNLFLGLRRKRGLLKNFRMRIIFRATIFILL